MSKTRKEDILQMSDEDIRMKISDDRENLRRMRFNHAISPLDNPMSLRSLRREIARLNTELNVRAAAAAQTVKKS
jgi:large subunit ribosomal protein L29